MPHEGEALFGGQTFVNRQAEHRKAGRRQTNINIINTEAITPGIDKLKRHLVCRTKVGQIYDALGPHLARGGIILQLCPDSRSRRVVAVVNLEPIDVTTPGAAHLPECELCSSGIAQIQHRGDELGGITRSAVRDDRIPRATMRTRTGVVVANADTPHARTADRPASRDIRTPLKVLGKSMACIHLYRCRAVLLGSCRQRQQHECRKHQNP